MSIHSWLSVNPNSHQDELVPAAHFEEGGFLHLIVTAESKWTSVSATIFMYSQIFMINKSLTLDKALTSSLLINEANFLSSTPPHEVFKQTGFAVWTQSSISSLGCQFYRHYWVYRENGWDKTRKYFFHWHKKPFSFNWPRNQIIFKALVMLKVLFNFLCKSPVH